MLSFFDTYLFSNVENQETDLLCSAVISHDHVRILEKHRIVLRSQDITPVGPYTEMNSPYDRMMDEAVLKVSGIFAEVRESRKIPLADLRKEVIPMMREVVHGERLISIFASLQAKDDYTYRHTFAVGMIATLIGTWLRMEHQELLQLTTAALLHDIGKMFIPQEILNKPGKLTEEEFDLIKSHTVLGYEMIKETVGLNYRQALVALQHHERMDGSGYPFGTTSEKIDLFSRIVAVADVFHAMTSQRIYHHASPFYEVLSQMEKDTFGVLDPEITKLFIGKIMNSLIGNQVLLTDGRQGTILIIHPHDPTHPLLQVEDQFVDLSKHLTLHIEQIL